MPATELTPAQAKELEENPEQRAGSGQIIEPPSNLDPKAPTIGADLYNWTAKQLDPSQPATTGWLKNILPSSENGQNGQKTETKEGPVINDPRVELVKPAAQPAQETPKSIDDPRVELVKPAEKPAPIEDDRVELVKPAEKPAQEQPPIEQLQPQSQLPSQFQTPPQEQPPAQTPLTIPTPMPESAQPDPHELQQVLIAQGKTPGEAQAIVNGQQPKTIAGKTPAPKPAVVTPTPPPEQQPESMEAAQARYEAERAKLPQQPAQPPPAEAKLPTPVDTLKAGEGNRVDPTALYSYLLGKFANSGLVGYVPPDGARWGIKTGSAAEWAAFGLAVAKQESDLNARSWNSHDPGGSAGLFQFGQTQKPFAQGDQFNPQQSADAFVRAVEYYLANKGRVANMGKTFGSILRPNEAGQYIAAAQKVAAGGSGKDLVSSGGDGEKGAPPAARANPLADQPLFSIPTAGGGGSQPASPLRPRFDSGGGTPSYREAPSQSGAGSIGLGALAGAAIGSAFGGGGEQAPPQKQGAKAAPSPEAETETPDVVASLMKRGFTKQEAIDFAKSSQTIAPGKGVAPLKIPPPAPSGPSAPAQLPAGQASVVTSKFPSPKQLMPGKVPKIVPEKGPPPAAPGPAPTGVDPSVITGLIKRGFTRQQAEDFAAKATVSQTGGPPTRNVPPPPPPKPPSDLPPPPPPEERPKPFEPTTEIEPYEAGLPAGSTHGKPTPPGHEAISQILKLVDQANHHASILSSDDPRVKKQADGYIKGEHFVEGDPFHDNMLNGLPGGKQGRQRQLLGETEQAIADKRAMHISYLSSPKEAEKFPTRDSRKFQYDKHSPEARLLGTTEGQLVGHSLIPLNMGVKLSKKTSEPHDSYIQGISTNVMANNFQHINDKLATMGRKTPYQEMGPKFYNDLEGFFHNLNAGHTATGRGYAIGTEDHPNEPDREHVPYKLTRKEADFIGAVINNTAAFAGHDDAKKLRELARANGTLITEKGETNRLLHDIEQADPGWSGRGSGKRGRVLEPSIRTFKTGLIMAHHPAEEHLGESIRPGKEYQQLTKAIARTSERGRPDIPIGASLHHTFQDNKAINEIERDFSDHRISELEARARLKDLGEDPGDYRFVSGSGGMITPYEDDPEALTPEEHSQMKDNLRQQWVGGKLNVEDYRKKSAEVPLPSKPSKKPTPPATSETEITPSPAPKPIVPTKPKAPKPQPVPEPVEAEETPETPAPAPTPVPAAPKPKPAPKAPPEPLAEPEEAPEPTVTKAPAPDEPLPAPVKKAAKAAKPVVPQEEKELTYKEMPPEHKEAYVSSRVKDRLANQIKGAVKLRPVMEGGKYKRDDAGNPQWEKDHYDLVNSPILGNKRLDRAKDQKFKDQEDIYGENEHAHLNDIDRKRLSHLEQKSAVDTMSDKIVDAYQKHMVNEPSVMAAKGWYTTMQQKLKKAFGPDAEIFAQLLGATSARTGVHQNFIQSLDAHDQLKNGNFANHIAKYNEAHEHLAKGEGALAKHMRDSGILDQMRTNRTLRVDKKTGEMVEPKTDAAAMADWITHHDILPRQKNGQKFNANSNQVLKVLAQKWLQSVKAPKTPNFAGNLSGRTREATIDVWAARFLHELGNEGNKKPWMLQPGGESGVRGLDFSFSQRAFRKAADKLGIEPDDAQAIAWYYQKHLWDQRGHTKGQGAKKASFDETFDKIFSPSGERMTDEEARKAFAGEKDEPEEEEEEAA